MDRECCQPGDLVHYRDGQYVQILRVLGRWRRAGWIDTAEARALMEHVVQDPLCRG